MSHSARKGAALLIAGIIASLFIFWAGLNIWGNWYDEWSGFSASMRISDGVCNIAVLPISGEIIPYADALGEEDGMPTVNPDDTLALLRDMESDPSILGVLARIDSYGGSPVASKIIADGFKRAGVPVAALIRESGISGGYWIASGAEHIIASPISDVGGIGITMSYVDNVGKNAKDGLHYEAISSGPYKDAGNPNKPLTREERAQFERDIGIVHDNFVQAVADNRKLPVETVQ